MKVLREIESLALFASPGTGGYHRRLREHRGVPLTAALGIQRRAFIRSNRIAELEKARTFSFRVLIGPKERSKKHTKLGCGLGRRDVGWLNRRSGGGDSRMARFLRAGARGPRLEDGSCRCAHPAGIGQPMRGDRPCARLERRGCGPERLLREIRAQSVPARRRFVLLRFAAALSELSALV